MFHDATLTTHVARYNTDPPCCSRQHGSQCCSMQHGASVQLNATRIPMFVRCNTDPHPLLLDATQTSPVAQCNTDPPVARCNAPCCSTQHGPPPPVARCNTDPSLLLNVTRIPLLLDATPPVAPCVPAIGGRECRCVPSSGGIADRHIRWAWLEKYFGDAKAGESLT